MSLVARVEAAIAAAGLPPAEVVLDPPKPGGQGDLATPVAMTIARALGKPPLEVAQAIAAHLPGATVAPPGFLNWTLPDLVLAPGPEPSPPPPQRVVTREELMGPGAGPVTLTGEAEPNPSTLRFWLQSKPASQPLELDAELMASETVENPAYYVAHTVQRVGSIAARAAEEGIQPAYGPVEPAGRQLAVLLLMLPDELRRQPQRRVRYAREVAVAFHSYYATQRIFGSEQASARLALVLETFRVLRTVLHEGLGVDPGRICRFRD